MFTLPSVLVRLGFLLSVGLWAFGCQAGPELGANGKPRSPLAVQLEAQATAAAGEPLALVARASARVPLDPVQITVRLPYDAVLLDGQTEWSGPLQPGQPVELRFTVRMPIGTGGTVIATAQYESEAGTRFAAGATLDVGTQGSLGGVTPDHGREGRRSERFGEGVIEYPAQ